MSRFSTLKTFNQKHQTKRSYVTDTSTIKSYKDIQTISSLPLIGDLLAVQKHLEDPIGGALTMFNESDVLRFNLFGKKNIRLWKPEHAKVVMENEGRYPYGSVNSLWPFHQLFQYLKVLPNVGVTSGEEWGVLRQKLQKGIFAPQDAAASIGRFEKTAVSAVERIVVEDDLEDVLFRTTFDLFNSFIFGETPDSLTNMTEEKRIMIDSSVRFLASTLKLFPKFMARYFNTKEKVQYFEEFRSFMDVVENLINSKVEYMKTAPEDDPIWSSYFAHYLQRNENADMEEFKSNLIGMFTASVDTTSNSIMWLLYHLATHPEVQEKINEEIKAVIKGDFPTPTEYSKLSYIKTCLKESSRLTPAVITNTRVLSVEIELDGYIIPPGTTIWMDTNVYGTRRPEIFENPLEFIPERWSRQAKEERKKDGTSFPHDSQYMTMPFGVGPRMCIAARLAEAEMVSFIQQLVKTYRLTIDNADEISLDFKDKDHLFWRPSVLPKLNYIRRD